ncbi:MAG: PQQ-dependent sugar dehydrogenase [Nocardioidaceae bacterium]
MNAAATSVSLRKNIVTGLPSTTGRRGGCALERGARGRLFIGTGDAATGVNPQRLASGGGKVLRVDPRTGRGLPGNRFAGSDRAMKRRVYTYGHRNVQGLARRAGGGMWSVEQGSYRDDEVNLLHRVETAVGQACRQGTGGLHAQGRVAALLVLRQAEPVGKADVTAGARRHLRSSPRRRDGAGPRAAISRRPTTTAPTRSSG